MPAAVAGAGIAAAGSLAGAIIGKKSQDKATDSSLQAQREALAYEREKEMRQEAAYKLRMDAWNRNRQGLLARYGIGGGGGGGQLNLGALVGRGGAPQAAPMPPPGGPPQMAQGLPPPMPMDLDNWNQWRTNAPVSPLG